MVLKRDVLSINKGKNEDDFQIIVWKIMKENK